MDTGGGGGPIEPGGGGGAPVDGQKAKFDIDRFKDCISRLFGVSLAPDDGRSRSFSSTRSEGQVVGVRGDRVFTVNTSMTAYNSSELRAMSTTSLPPGTVTGVTLPSSPYLNFVASEIASNPSMPSVYVTAAQVHEIGNSLRYITGRTPRAIDVNLYNYDHDAGNALGECVYGGWVLPNGTITKNPGGR
jgi:hypothetical protein